MPSDRDRAHIPCGTRTLHCGSVADAVSRRRPGAPRPQTVPVRKRVLARDSYTLPIVQDGGAALPP